MAYRWGDEKFTRLIPGIKNEKKKCKNLLISHHPIKQMYKNPTEYREVMLPLVEEEYFFTSEIFKHENTVEGTVMLCERICSVHGNQVLYSLTGTWTR